MRPTELLTDEHRVILAVLDVAEREAMAIAEKGVVDAPKVERIVDFIRSFADGHHHLKEEDLLFARMVEKGFPQEFGPIGVMLSEHDQGRAHVARVVENLPAAAAGEAAALAAVGQGLAAYAQLLRHHIYKEDNILYPMADQAFSEQDQAELSAAFDRVEEGATGARYRALARELTGA